MLFSIMNITPKQLQGSCVKFLFRNLEHEVFWTRGNYPDLSDC